MIAAKLKNKTKSVSVYTDQQLASNQPMVMDTARVDGEFEVKQSLAPTSPRLVDEQLEEGRRHRSLEFESELAGGVSDDEVLLSEDLQSKHDQSSSSISEDDDKTVVNVDREGLPGESSDAKLMMEDEEQALLSEQLVAPGCSPGPAEDELCSTPQPGVNELMAKNASPIPEQVLKEPSPTLEPVKEPKELSQVPQSVKKELSQTVTTEQLPGLLLTEPEPMIEEPSASSESLVKERSPVPESGLNDPENRDSVELPPVSNAVEEDSLSELELGPFPSLESLIKTSSMVSMEVFSENVLKEPSPVADSTKKEVFVEVPEKSEMLAKEISLVSELTVEEPSLPANSGAEELTSEPFLEQSVPVLKEQPSLAPEPIVHEPVPVPAPDSVLEKSSPVPEPVLKEPSPIPEPLLKEPSPAPEPVLKEPSPMPEPVLKEPSPVPEPVLKEPSPIPEPILKEPSPAPVLKEPSPIPEPVVLNGPSPASEAVLEEPSSAPEPVLKERSLAPEMVLKEPSAASEPVLKETSPAPELLLKEPSPVPEPVLKEPSPVPEPVLKEASPAPEPVLKEPSPAPEPVLKEPSPIPEPVLKEPSPAPEPVLKEPSPIPEPVVLNGPSPASEAVLKEPSSAPEPVPKEPSPTPEPVLKEQSLVLEMVLKETSPAPELLLKEPPPVPEPLLKEASPAPEPVPKEQSLVLEMVLKETSPAPELLLKEPPPVPEPLLKEASPAPEPVPKEASPPPEPVLKEPSPSPEPVLKELFPAPEPVMKELSPGPEPVLNKASPAPEPVLKEPSPALELVLKELAPVFEPVPNEVSPEPEPVLKEPSLALEPVSPVHEPVLKEASPVPEPLKEPSSGPEPVLKEPSPAPELILKEPSPAPEPVLKKPSPILNEVSPQPEPVVKEPSRSPEPVLKEVSPVPESILKEPSQVPETVLKKSSPGPETVLREPSPASELILKEPSPAPEPLKEPSPVPSPILNEASPEPEPVVKESSPSLEPVLKEVSPVPQPVLKEPSQVPEPVLKKSSPGPEPVLKEPSPAPELILKEPSPGPKPVLKEASPAPELVLKEPSPAPEPVQKEVSAAPEPVQKGPSPVPELVQEPSPAPEPVLKEPSPEPESEKAPFLVPESVQEPSPAPELVLKESSPAPEPVQKAPSPLESGNSVANGTVLKSSDSVTMKDQTRPNGEMEISNAAANSEFTSPSHSDAGVISPSHSGRYLESSSASSAVGTESSSTPGMAGSGSDSPSQHSREASLQGSGNYEASTDLVRSDGQETGEPNLRKSKSMKHFIIKKGTKSFRNIKRTASHLGRNKVKGPTTLDPSLAKPVMTQDWDPTCLLEELYLDFRPSTRGAALSGEMARHYGYLEKLPKNATKASMMKGWKRRYFRVMDDKIYYYEERTSPKALGFVRLSISRINPIPEKNQIQIIEKGGQSIMLRARDKEDVTAWHRAILLEAAHPTPPMASPSSPTPSDDAASVLIIDIGASSVRAGFSGNNAYPEMYFPAVASLEATSYNAIGSGTTALLPVNRYGAHQVYPRKELLRMDRTDSNLVLRALSCIIDTIVSDLDVDTESTDLILTVPRTVPDSQREELLEQLFEDFQFSAVCFQDQSVVSLYSYNTTSGIIVNIGDHIDVVPIIDGYTIEAGVSHLPHGGNAITENLCKLITSKGMRYFSETEMYIVRLMKEQLCYVSQKYNDDITRCEATPAGYTRATDMDRFQLPDHRKVVALDVECFKAPEGLFKPYMWGKDVPGVHELVWKAIQACPIDQRREMAKRIYLSGSTTLLPCLQERLQKEVAALATTGIAVEVHAGQSRQHAAFLGAAVLATLGSFQDYLITKEEFGASGFDVLKKWKTS